VSLLAMSKPRQMMLDAVGERQWHCSLGASFRKFRDKGRTNSM
jgi:hypothetical protein